VGRIPTHKEVFDRIYSSNFRGGSGPGSSEENTRQYRAFLKEFLVSNRIKSVVDVGCGDWQLSRHIGWSGIDYLGIDVSAVAIDNTKRFARPGVAFRELDATRDALPPADLLIAKDVL